MTDTPTPILLADARRLWPGLPWVYQPAIPDPGIGSGYCASGETVSCDIPPHPGDGPTGAWAYVERTPTRYTVGLVTPGFRWDTGGYGDLPSVASELADRLRRYLHRAPRGGWTVRYGAVAKWYVAWARGGGKKEGT